MKQMRVAILLSTLLYLSACGSVSKKKFSEPFPLSPDMDNAITTRWAEKEVLDSRLIDDMEGDLRWVVVKGPVDIANTRENHYDGSQSMRYHVSMIDSTVLKNERTLWNTFAGWQGGESCIRLEFDKPQDWTDYNRISFWVYIHPSKNPNVNLAFDLVEEDNIEETLTPGREMNVVLPQGTWQNVVWEIDYQRRNRIKAVEVWQTLTGYDREMGEQYVTVDFDKIEIQKVKHDHYSGWDVADGDIAFSHVGYRPADAKTAIASPADTAVFTLTDATGKTVYEGAPQMVENGKGNRFALLDFSDFIEPGTYCLHYGGIDSREFQIADDVWLMPVFSALNFYFCQRCGYEVPGIHSVCHQDIYGFYGDEKKPVNGGWHDAGDLSQGFWRTADGCLALMKALDMVSADGKQSELARRIEDEAAWGVEWLLKTRFSDGRHLSWITGRIYSDNQPGTLDDVAAEAENVVWENFQGTVVFTEAAQKLGVLSAKKKELEAAAVDNWQQAMASRKVWNEATYLEAAYGAMASVSLFQRFGNAKYRDAALQFGQLLMGCQEQEFKEGIPITGYFYTDTSRSRIIRNSHAAFEEVTMMALRMLCQAFPDVDDWMKWYSAAAIYSQYFMKRGSTYASPYDVLPNGVFRRADMGPETNFGDPNYYVIQYKDGTQLNDNYALRTFPIWDNYSFHGGTNCQLSATWALAEASALLNDSEGKRLVKEQLEWVLGRNPFCQSLMYGVGYNYSPLFVYCTRNIVGALPVGIDCYKNDEPFWHASAYATFREIWIEPVNRFVASVATFIGNNADKPKVSVDLQTEGDKVVARLKAAGKKSQHRVNLKLSNATTDFEEQQFSLADGEETTISFTLAATDTTKPYVAALVVDGDTEHATLITGESR